MRSQRWGLDWARPKNDQWNRDWGISSNHCSGIYATVNAAKTNVVEMNRIVTRLVHLQRAQRFQARKSSLATEIPRQ